MLPSIIRLKWTSSTKMTPYGSSRAHLSSSLCTPVRFYRFSQPDGNFLGFGLLESGSVSAKDEVNIMVKNVVDVVFGGLSYWSVGYGLRLLDPQNSNE